MTEVENNFAHLHKQPSSQAAKQPSSQAAKQPSSQAAKQPSSQAAKQPSKDAVCFDETASMSYQVAHQIIGNGPLDGHALLLGLPLE
ncbi:hypothetical protein [Pseudomonas sp. A-B-26]|uniref:hypothetical protein n=1 Tax=Pseudomonas sp. A-B-26 TaxID=2832406 RepID=UPI001CC16D9F|nr:hypothetical protein [Pseudomonas sp. A-B-26]